MEAGGYIYKLEKGTDGNWYLVSYYPSISLSKTVYAGHSQGEGCPGEEQLNAMQGVPLTYCFEIKNDGEIKLGSITLEDSILGITQDDMTLLSGSLPLEPGDSMVFYYESQVDQALENVANVTAFPVDDTGIVIQGLASVEDSDNASVLTNYNPGISIEKTGYIGHDGGSSCSNAQDVIEAVPGTDVTYCFKVTNTGNADLGQIKIVDQKIGYEYVDNAILSPGESRVYFVETKLSDGGINSVEVTANPLLPDGTPMPGDNAQSAMDTSQSNLLQPSLILQKTVFKGSFVAGACPGQDTLTVYQGETITYCFKVTNTGDVPLGSLQIEDQLIGGGIDINDMTQVPGSGSLPLLPGKAISYYYTTEAPSDEFINHATISALPLDSNNVPYAGASSITNSDSAKLYGIIPNPKLTFEKTVYLGHDGGSSCPGVSTLKLTDYEQAKITYCFEVINNGNVPLGHIRIDDPALDLVESELVPVSGTLPVMPDDSVIFYIETTQKEGIVNVATVKALPVKEDGTPLDLELEEITSTDSASISIEEAVDIPIFIGYGRILTILLLILPVIYRKKLGY